MPFIRELAAGEVIAQRYEVKRIIGAGGMSRVYLVSDLKLPGKVWAMKEVAASPHIHRSIEEEAALLIALDHPRLPTIIDIYAHAETGHLYLVMDYVEGDHLDRYAAKHGQPLPLQMLIGFGLQICEGLHYLHSRQPPIIHRDLKPANLLVNSDGEIRFIDFGIARWYKENQAEDTVLIGSVGFAAPEQYGGKQSDCRTDLYSLGAVLLFLGTGTIHTAWSEEAALLLRRHGYEPLLPVLYRLLRSDPRNRYASAAEVSSELSVLAAGLMIDRNQLPEGMENSVSRTARCQVIAVMGVSPGVGTTHTAILLAHTLAGYARKVAIVELEPKSAAFRRLESIVLGKTKAGKASSPPCFQINSVDYIRQPARSEWIELLAAGYDFVVCDIGSANRKEWLEEFARADLPVIVASGAEWREEEAMVLGSRIGEAVRRKWVCLVPLGNAAAVRRLRKHLATERVYMIAAESDPFDPGQETVTAIKKACAHSIAELSPPVGRSVFKRRRWKGSGH